MVKLDDTKTSSSRSGYDVNAPKVTYEGYIVDLLDQLASLLGFDYRIQIVPDGQYGFRRLDGTWNGMIGQLLRKVTTGTSAVHACMIVLSYLCLRFDGGWYA